MKKNILVGFIVLCLGTARAQQLVPDFKVTLTDGSEKSIRDIAAQSRFTLVDFEAYWCKPCKEDVPDMKKTYEAFAGKGFNIISVATDPRVPEWEKAIEEDRLPWLRGMQVDAPSKDVFKLRTIPAYMLLDKEGKIVVLDMNSNVPALNTYDHSMTGALRVGKVNSALRGDGLYKTVEGLFK